MSLIHRLDVLARWQRAEIRDSRKTVLSTVAKRVLAFKQEFYDPVEEALGIPWYVIGALDMREANFDHLAYLGNGDPLNKPTKHVPKNRGPFLNWFSGAIDSLKLDAFDSLPPGGHWDIVTALIKCELFNGSGYAKHAMPSPYVWAATNIQVPGKYTSDGHFDPNVMDVQPGCAALFLALKHNHGVDLKEE